MIRSFQVSFILLLLFLFVGCASDGTITNPFVDNTPPPATPYYYDEFANLPIPNEMSEVSDDTVISSTPSGVRTGIQHFKGRVEFVSLVNAMRKNMSNQGWTLRSLFRSQQTILVYEMADRVCTLYITDGVIYTDMRVFMSELLHGDSVETESSQYLAPSTSNTKSTENKKVLSE